MQCDVLLLGVGCVVDAAETVHHRTQSLGSSTDYLAELPVWWLLPDYQGTAVSLTHQPPCIQ